MSTSERSAPGSAVVVGSGVIGTACAYYLMRSGWKVSLIDRGALAGGSSHANCGFVCPSHILPLAEPGMVGQALRSLLQRNSPFAIKPRLDPALWSWLLRFARRCNERDMIEAGRGIQPLLLSSLELYRELVEREALDCEFEERGMLFAYRSKDADGVLRRDRPADERGRSTARPVGSIPTSSSRSSRPSSPAWRAAGITTTTPTCGPTSSCGPGTACWSPAGPRPGPTAPSGASTTGTAARHRP